MHKIKEMLHSDKDSNASHSSSTTHNHGHTHTDMGRGHLDTREFKHEHVRHGEIEHGNRGLTRSAEYHHEHGHHHHGDQHLKHSHGEKHIYTEREVTRGSDLYREGINPTMNREVISECRHVDGTSRARINEGKIVKETIKEVELHKVQPVIHREREQKEIRHVVEPHQKFEVKDTKVLHREKDIDLGTRREASTLESSRSMHAPVLESSREYVGTDRQHQELPMRVEEHIHKSVEEHIHPVVYKEILKPKVMEETHHLYETVKEAPIETYEVRQMHMHGDGLRNAERSFFNEETSRGISIDEKHIHDHHSRNLHNSGEKHLGGRIHDHGTDRGFVHQSSQTRFVETDRNWVNEPIVGHHQNIGAHHVAGMIPAGHNTAYDAALCNECTGNQVCSHGQRDAALMQKMNEKKIVKDRTLSKKEQKKLRKEGDYSTADRISHEHVHVV